MSSKDSVATNIDSGASGTNSATRPSRGSIKGRQSGADKMRHWQSQDVAWRGPKPRLGTVGRQLSDAT